MITSRIDYTPLLNAVGEVSGMNATTVLVSAVLIISSIVIIGLRAEGRQVA